MTHSAKFLASTPAVASARAPRVPMNTIVAHVKNIRIVAGPKSDYRNVILFDKAFRVKVED